MLESVIISMKQDGVVEAFLAATPERQVEIALAYAAHAVRKNDIFTCLYKTNPEARAEFQKTVLALV